MGSIDLKNCCTKQVTTAPRDICARLNTFLFECKRQYQPDDKNSLIVVRQGKYTIIRQVNDIHEKFEFINNFYTFYFFCADIYYRPIQNKSVKHGVHILIKHWLSYDHGISHLNRYQNKKSQILCEMPAKKVWVCKSFFLDYKNICVVFQLHS